MAEVLALESVSKTFPHPAGPIVAVNSISLRIQPGELVALSGPSGSGKSTLLNIVGLTEAPTSGFVFVKGERVAFEDDEQLTALRRSDFGFVFQYFNLLPYLTALENVAMSLLLNGSGWRTAQDRAYDALEKVGLNARAAHYPAQLSGGEMQRVALCRAFVHRPAIILADEPTGNLDSTNGAVVLDLLRQQARAGVAVLMATHSVVARERADRVINLRDGQLV